MKSPASPGGPATADLFRRWNAIAQSPGDLDLIREYVASARERISATSDPTEAVAQTDALLSFLSQQATHVSADDVDALAALADEVIADGQPTPDTSTQEGEDSMAESFQAFCADLPTDLPADADGLRERLAEAVQFRDYAEETGAAFPTDAEAYVARLQAALQHDAASVEGRALFDLACQESDATVTAYLLQSCEAAVRQVVLLEPQVDSERVEAGRVLLAALRQESERVQEQVQREEAEAAWTSFEKEHRTKRRAVETWKRPKKVALDGACTRHLNAVQELMQAVQRVLPRLAHPNVQQKATALLESLGEKLEEAAVAQQRRYNQHAMAAIQTGYKAGVEHAGFIDNERKIGKALIDHLGPLDLRHLTSEVQRCYSEVFEYLYGRLDRPGSANDFESDKNKLYVLKEMFDADKTPLDDA